MKLPKSTRTCLFNVPPVPTTYWDDVSWEKWIAMCCPCEAHTAWRESEKAEQAKDSKL